MGGKGGRGDFGAVSICNQTGSAAYLPVGLDPVVYEPEEAFALPEHLIGDHVGSLSGRGGGARTRTGLAHVLLRHARLPVPPRPESGIL